MKTGAMKKIGLVVLFLSFVIIVYFFIKEQVRGMVLSQNENTILSVCYLLIAAALIILFRIRSIENKNRGNSGNKTRKLSNQRSEWITKVFISHHINFYRTY